MRTRYKSIALLGATAVVASSIATTSVYASLNVVTPGGSSANVPFIDNAPISGTPEATLTESLTDPPADFTGTLTSYVFGSVNNSVGSSGETFEYVISDVTGDIENLTVGGWNTAASVGFVSATQSSGPSGAIAFIDNFGTLNIDHINLTAGETAAIVSETPLQIYGDAPASVQNSDTFDTTALAPVPEPTTMIAGAFLLLPMGASTLRALRKNRAS